MYGQNILYKTIGLFCIYITYHQSLAHTDQLHTALLSGCLYWNYMSNIGQQYISLQLDSSVCNTVPIKITDTYYAGIYIH